MKWEQNPTCTQNIAEDKVNCKKVNFNVFKIETEALQE